jgi:hypothetical protein
MAVKLESEVKDETVVFNVLDESTKDNVQFSTTELIELYKKCYQLNQMRNFDKSIMEKEFEI